MCGNFQLNLKDRKGKENYLYKQMFSLSAPLKNVFQSINQSINQSYLPVWKLNRLINQVFYELLLHLETYLNLISRFKFVEIFEQWVWKGSICFIIHSLVIVPRLLHVHTLVGVVGQRLIQTQHLLVPPQHPKCLL